MAGLTTFLKRGLLLVCSAVILIASSPVRAQEGYRGIIPLVTTREEVEKILGKPTSGTRYEFKDKRVTVIYRENACADRDRSCSCLAPIGTVLFISVEPYGETFIKDIIPQPGSQWRRYEVMDHVTGIHAYTNDKTGVTYEFEASDGLIRDIIYGPAQAMCERLSNRSFPLSEKCGTEKGPTPAGRPF